MPILATSVTWHATHVTFVCKCSFEPFWRVRAPPVTAFPPVTFPGLVLLMCAALGACGPHLKTAGRKLGRLQTVNFLSAFLRARFSPAAQFISPRGTIRKQDQLAQQFAPFKAPANGGTNPMFRRLRASYVRVCILAADLARRVVAQADVS